MLPDTTFEQNLAVANRICEIVRNIPFEAGWSILSITVSLGVSLISAQADATLSD